MPGGLSPAPPPGEFRLLCFLGHEKLDTKQIYAQSSPHIIQSGYRGALLGT
jgi:hypothetical protein